MLVSELTDALAPKQGDETIVVDLADVQIDDEATSLEISGAHYALDEIAEKALCSYLPIPHGYVKKCPPELKVHNLRFWLERFAEASTQINVERGHITSIHSSELITVPNEAVAQIVTAVFDSEDQVVLQQGSDLLHVDVLSQSHKIEIPNPHGVAFRPAVGDITNGGVRILTYPHQVKDPSVCSFFERLVCTNGMTTDQKLGAIKIKGISVDEVIEEMESAARKLFGALDQQLERYAATARTPVPGNIQAFVSQLAREFNLKRQVVDEVMELINQLGQHATIYDVIQAFTEVANLTVDLPYEIRMRLQTLGGTLALETEKMIARCHSCQGFLP